MGLVLVYLGSTKIEIFLLKLLFLANCFLLVFDAICWFISLYQSNCTHTHTQCPAKSYIFGRSNLLLLCLSSLYLFCTITATYLVKVGLYFLFKFFTCLFVRCMIYREVSYLCPPLTKPNKKFQNV